MYIYRCIYIFGTAVHANNNQREERKSRRQIQIQRRLFARAPLAKEESSSPSFSLAGYRRFLFFLGEPLQRQIEENLTLVLPTPKSDVIAVTSRKKKKKKRT